MTKYIGFDNDVYPHAVMYRDMLEASLAKMKQYVPAEWFVGYTSTIYLTATINGQPFDTAATDCAGNIFFSPALLDTIIAATTAQARNFADDYVSVGAGKYRIPSKVSTVLQPIPFLTRHAQTKYLDDIVDAMAADIYASVQDQIGLVLHHETLHTLRGDRWGIAMGSGQKHSRLGSGHGGHGSNNHGGLNPFDGKPRDFADVLFARNMQLMFESRHFPTWDKVTAIGRDKTLSELQKATQIEAAVKRAPAALQTTLKIRDSHAATLRQRMNAAQDYTINSRILDMRAKRRAEGENNAHEWFWDNRKFPAFTFVEIHTEAAGVAAGTLPLRTTNVNASAWHVFDQLSALGNKSQAPRGTGDVLGSTPSEAGGQGENQGEGQGENQGEGQGEGQGESPEEAHKRIVSSALHHARGEEQSKETAKASKPKQQPQPGQKQDRTLRKELTALGKQAGAHHDDAFLREIAAELLHTPVVPWGTIVADAVSSELQREGIPDFTYRRYNRHSAYAGYMLPALVARAPAEIAVCIDTSGSIDRTLLRMFQVHLEQFRQVHATAKFRVIYCDTTIRGDHTVSPGEPLEFTPKGGGGTNFDQVFKRLADENYKPALMLWFTDMEVHLRHLPAPSFPVTWVYYHDNTFANTSLPDWVPIDAVIPVDAQQG